jgi:hypothetical protein
VGVLEVQAVARAEAALVVVEGAAIPGNTEVIRLMLTRKKGSMMLLLLQRTTKRSGNKLLGKLVTSNLLVALKIRAVSQK